MGQRLNIEITDGEKTLANSYYHWSAYSGPALCLLKEIICAYKSAKSVRMLDIAVELLQATGAGINEDERSRIDADKSGRFDNIHFNEATNRNDGLIAVTDEGIEETRSWEEGRVTIDLASESFAFDVFWRYLQEEFKEEYECDECDDFPERDFDFCESTPFSDITKVEELMNECPDGYRLQIGRAHV